LTKLARLTPEIPSRSSIIQLPTLARIGFFLTREAARLGHRTFSPHRLFFADSPAIPTSSAADIRSSFYVAPNLPHIFTDFAA
jgi:hypothetical protein